MNIGSAHKPFYNGGVGMEGIRHTDRGGVYARASRSDETRTIDDRDPYKESIVFRMREKLSEIAIKQSVHDDALSGKERALTTPERSVEDVVLGNPDLPSFEKRHEIAEAVRNHQVVVISGETGCGKSTQVPQILLDMGHENICVTQPRILAANGVGERIADELVGSLGEEARDLVAVQTSERFERPEGAKIFIRTDGLQLVMDMERYLNRLSYEQAQIEAGNIVLVIDEVHEGNENQVMLLALVQRMIDTYPDMRVVIMSATVDPAKYTNYFGEGEKREVPVIEIEGRPSELEWQERSDVGAIAMIQELLDDGDKLEPGDDILLFTSGKPEIERLIKKGMAAGLPIEFVGLDASMERYEQDRAIASHPNTIRVIVATPVAMTSVTFPNVKYVIDEGIVKNKELDNDGGEGLRPQLCSQAEVRQRGGRAGRVRPGVHILVRPHEETGLGFVSLEQRPLYPPPPIYSTDLSKNVLRFANYGYDFEDFNYIDTISQASIRQAKDKLYNLGALDEDNTITELGKTMEKFSVLRPEYARMMAEAMKPGVPQNVLLNTAMIVAAYEADGLRDFAKKAEKGREPWRKIVRNPSNDPMLELELFRHIQKDQEQMDVARLRSIGCSSKNVKKAFKIYEKSIRAAGLDPWQVTSLPLDGDEKDEVEHCLSSGLIEHIYVRSKTSRRGVYQYHHLTHDYAVPREISNRSVVTPKDTEMLAGHPRFFVAPTKEGQKEHHILENNQQIDGAMLNRLDFRTHTVTVDTIARNGIVMFKKEQRIGSKVLGRETVVASAEEVKESEMLALVLNNPGHFQLQLRALKKELEELQELTMRKLNKIDQTVFEKLLLDAIRQSGSTELHIIDAKLGELMGQDTVIKSKYIAPGFEAVVRNNAVPMIEIEGEVYDVHYEKGQPIVKRLAPSDITNLPDNVYLPDGREVFFRVPKYASDGSRQPRGYHDAPAWRARNTTVRALEMALAGHR